MVIQKCEKSKKWIFSKNCLTLFVSGREKKRAFSCTLSVLAKIFFWTKTMQSGFQRKLQKKKSKNDTFFWKRVFFDMVEKVGFTNCVFEKLCFPENTIFIVFSAKHSFSKTKTVCWKTVNLWKIVGCFWTWQNGVFWVCFWGFNIKRFVLVCLALFQKC